MVVQSRTLSVEEAGRLLGVSRYTAYRLAREGHLPVVRLGRRKLVVSRAALERLLEGGGERPSGPPAA